jgi:hypothetical protein
MPVVVADTSPINYLIQIAAIDLLPKLFESIAISAAVHAELTHRRTLLALPGVVAKTRAQLLLTSWRNLPRREQRHRCFSDETLDQPKTRRRSRPQDPDTPREGAVGDGQFSK